MGRENYVLKNIPSVTETDLVISHLQNTGRSLVRSPGLLLLLGHLLLLHLDLQDHVLDPVVGMSEGKAVVYPDLA